MILRRELIRTPGLQPEDLGVLVELLLRVPWLPSTMEVIRRDLQAQGWKMGKDRYNAIAGRLTKAGHLARIPAYDEATQRPMWVTRVYRNPANNDQYVDLGITESVQVNAEMRETGVSPGQSRNAENPRSGSPPTPPGGGNYLLPLPHHRHHRSRAGCAGGGGGGLRSRGNGSGGAVRADASAAVVCGTVEGQGDRSGAAGGDG
ncbi:hypothetical protein ACFUJU_34880 [Streptomyces sp. NPDC057235]|uniref:hypothetical protein n=1 Tax=Streptomyces sp. NPDC057235 TaxID=3346058 RepID=UPI0036293812